MCSHCPKMLMIDFGWLQHDANTPAKTKVGTPIYMAPEIIMAGQRYDAKVSYTSVATSMCGLAGAVHTTLTSIHVFEYVAMYHVQQDDRVLCNQQTRSAWLVQHELALQHLCM